MKYNDIAQILPYFLYECKSFDIWCRHQGEGIIKVYYDVILKGDESTEEEKVFEITAREVTIEVRDDKTGVTYRRTLPIDFYENANFLKLTGENLDGSLSSIVFYSMRGIERVKDLTGKGADHDSCGTHQ